MARVEEDLMMDGQVQRLHAALVAALRRSRAAPFDGPVTVAEIYQDLVPYRSVRAALGFELNGDYEHTLLRLLSGEGQLAKLDPPEAADELRAELDSPNPNVGLFRKFAGCDVWVSSSDAEPVRDEAEDARPAWMRLDAAVDWRNPAGAAAPSAAEDREGAGEGEGAAVAAAPLAAMVDTPARAEAKAAVAEPVAEPVDDAEEPEYELVPVQRRGGAAAAVETAEGAHCAFCDGALPARRELRYCPFCGTDQSHRPCAGCGEAVEPGWRFCVACGTAVAGGG